MKTYNVSICGVVVGTANGEDVGEALDQAVEYYDASAEDITLELFSDDSPGLWKDLE